METLKERYCRMHFCPLEEFEQGAMRDSLYPLAKLLAALGGVHSRHLRIDRSLVDYCSRLESLAQIDAELREFASSPANRSFIRGALRVRLSGRKFRKLAAGCLAPAARVR
jgi:hypothetical protein